MLGSKEATLKNSFELLPPSFSGKGKGADLPVQNYLKSRRQAGKKVQTKASPSTKSSIPRPRL